MQILVHIGFNKCASSYIQRALAEAQGALREAGIFYAVEGERWAQYGLSRHYGFGPEADGLTPRSLPWLAARARERGCTAMIVSSEYLSLARPQGIAAFAGDLRSIGAEAQILVLSRDLVPWLKALFNQYVKTVDGGPFYDSIDSFVTRVLGNGAIDLAGRYRIWREAASGAPGIASVLHHAIAEGQAKELVLTPFSAFSGFEIPPPAGGENPSLTPGALYLTARLRQARPGPVRDRLLARLASGGIAVPPAPAAYLEIGARNLERLRDEVAVPFAVATGSEVRLGEAA